MRLILVLGLAVLAGLVLAWLFTRDKKYWLIARRIVRYIVVPAVVVVLVFVAERVILR